MTQTLLSFGHGYTARVLAERLIEQGWTIYGTTRKPEKANEFRKEGVTPLLWPETGITAALQETTHILISTGPDADGDPVLNEFRREISAIASQLAWVGYLSTTGVYGDHQGGWVDESTPLTPSTKRGQLRVDAENAWASIPSLPLHIFRLAGIYGPGRGPFKKIKDGTARRIIKENQYFSRTHVDDIAQVLLASMADPHPGAAYNVCDDEPAPPQEVIGHAAELLGLPLPPEISFEDADLSPMARSFYAESKRVSNQRIKEDLGVSLLYPTYREGLAAMLEEKV